MANTIAMYAETGLCQAGFMSQPGPQVLNVELFSAQAVVQKVNLVKSVANYSIHRMQGAGSMNRLDTAAEFAQIIPPLQLIRKESRHERC